MSFIMASFSLCDNVVIVVLQTFAAAKLQQIFEIHKDFTVKIKFICIFSRKACYFLFASFAGERIIIRQIRLSASALHELTFLACGASSVFVSCSSMLQTPEACPLRNPPRWLCHRSLLSAWQPTFVSRDGILGLDYVPDEELQLRHNIVCCAGYRFC